MVEHIVPLSGNTSAGANMVLLGVDPGFHSVQLHRINSKLDFVSGQAVVGIRTRITQLLDIIMMKVTNVTSHASIQHRK
jgi:hypothetical protein